MMEHSPAVDGPGRHGARLRWQWIPLVLFAAAAVLGLVRASAHSAPGAGTLTVTTDVTSPGSALALNNLRYSDAMAAIATAQDAGSLSIAFTAGTATTITGLPTFTAESYEYFTTNDGGDDDQRPRLVIRGHRAQVFGQQAEVIVTAKWNNDVDDFKPQLAVLFRFSSIDLRQLNTGLQFPITAENVIVGVGTAFEADGTTPLDQLMVASKLDPNNETKFFEDGTGVVLDPFRVANRGVTVAATVVGGELVEGAKALGSVDRIALLGSIGDTGVLKGGAAATGVTLTGKVVTTTPPALADAGVTLDGEWTVGFVNRGASWDAELGGSVALDLGNGPVTIAAKAKYTTAGTPQWTLEGIVGANLTKVFGQDWLTLESASLLAKFDRAGGATVSLGADMTVGPVTGSATVTFGRTAATPTTPSAPVAGLSLRVTGEYSVGAIVAAIGQTTPDPSWDTTIKQVDFQVTAASGPNVGTSMVVAIQGSGTVLQRPDTAPCGAFDGVEASLLFRFESSGGTNSFLAAAGIPTPGTDPSLSIKQLDCSASFDWTLPRVFLTAASTDIKTNFQNLDTPTSQFFRPLKCVTLTTGCPIDLEVGKGLTIAGSVTLDGAVGNALDSLGISTTGVIKFSGTLPVMGNTSVAKLRIELPTLVSADADAIIKQGNILLDAEGGPSGIKVKLSGNAVFRVERIDQSSCAAAALRFTEARGNRCYDEVAFGVTATIEATTGPPPGASFTLSATLANWPQPFGIPWLTVTQAAIDLKVEASATGAPSIGVTIGAQLLLGSGDRQKDLTLTFGVGVTSAPPTFQVTALTVGSSAGFTLREVAEAFVPSITPATLASVPDLSLRNLWFAYAASDNPNLCARAGLFISAELHLGATDTPSGARPGCTNNGFLGASCAPGSPTCLAGILLSVDKDGFKLQGNIAPFSMGPIELDGLEIEATATPLQQSFVLKAGATLYDPALWAAGVRPLPVWASAFVDIDLSQRLGALRGEIEVCAIVGGTTPAQAGCPGGDAAVKASASALLKFNVLDGKDFLKNAEFKLTLALEARGLVELGSKIADGLQPVTEVAVSAANDVSTTLGDWWTRTSEDRCTVLRTASCEQIRLADPAGSAAQEYINARILQTDNAIRNNVPLNLFCFVTRAGFGLQSCIDFYAKRAMEQNLAFIESQGGAPYIALHGVNGTGSSAVFVVQGDILVSPTFFLYPQDPVLPILGVTPCGPGGALEGNALCDAGPNQPMDLSEVKGDLAYQELLAIDPRLAAYLDAYGVGGTAAGAFGDALVAEAGITAEASPTDAATLLQNLRTLGSRVDLSLPLIVCEASINYEWPGEGGSPPPLELITRVDAYGNNVVTTGSAVGGIDPNELTEEVIGGVLDGPLDELGCPVPASAPGLTIDSIVSTVVEGTPLTVAGTATPGAAVNVSWGDGTLSGVVAAADGTWSATHTYGDGPATVVVEAGTEDASVTRLVSVTNARPSITGLVLPSTVDEGSAVELVASLADAGVDDRLSATVAWGDGTTSTIDLGTGRSLRISHTYVDDDPTATPRDTVAVTVTVTDDDGGSAMRSASLDVVNVAPQLSGFTVSAGGVDLPRGADGRWEIPEGTPVDVTGVITDPGVRDTQRLQIAWGDGDLTPLAVTRDAPGATTWTFRATKVFADDDPTGTPRDAVELRVFVADDDMSFADGDSDNTVGVDLAVVDVAPIVEVTPVTSSVQYSDRLGDLTIVASDVSGTTGATGIRSERLAITTRFRVADGAWNTGLPGDLSLGTPTCTDSAGRQRCVWTVTGRAAVAPGVYTIEVTVTDDDTRATVATATVTVLPEDAAVTYIGPRVVSAPTVATGSVTVELRAVVRDSSVTPATTDTTAGDVTRATVTFVDRATGRVLCSAPVTAMFAGNTTTGGASCTFTLATAGNGPWVVDVGSVVGGWYRRDDRTDDASVTALRFGSIDLHGQHFVTASSGAGTFAPTAGTRVNGSVGHLGFSTGRAVSGTATLDFVSGGRTYRIDVTAVNTLGVISTGVDTKRIDLDAVATLTDVTDARRPVVVARDLRLQLRYVDWARNATPDQMSFALWAADGTLVSGMAWDGTRMVERTLAGGQVLMSATTASNVRV